MKSFEAMHEAVWPDVEIIGKAVHKSESTMYKWMQPSTDHEDSGTYNPIDRLITIIETALKIGRSVKKATTPISYLANHFNHVIVPIPLTEKGLMGVGEEFAKLVHEFGDVSREYAEAIRDGRISGMELDRLSTHVWHLVQHGVLFLEKAKEAVR